jgi:hypothetical protein
MTITLASEAVVFPVKIRRINSEERIPSYALGPLIRGRRAPSILRLKFLPVDVWQIENLTKGHLAAARGRWRPDQRLQADARSQAARDAQAGSLSSLYPFCFSLRASTLPERRYRAGWHHNYGCSLACSRKNMIASRMTK